MEFDVREMWRALQLELVSFAPRLVAAIALLLAFWLGYRILRPVVRTLFERAHIQGTLTHLIVDDLMRWAFYLIGLVMALGQLGVNVAAALAGLSVAGIALGFAAQEMLANMIAGFLIFWDKPFLVGDWVTVGDEYGQVQEVTMRSTRIRTNDNAWVVIPNRRIIDQVLVNHSKDGVLRLEVPMGIAYKESIPEARKAILAALDTLPRVLRDPPPDVVVSSCGSSSVDLKVRVWIEDAKHERPVFFEVMERTKLALDAAGIEIPYHHLQLFLEDVKDPVWQKLLQMRA